jgi:hypothetical protein
VLQLRSRVPLRLCYPCLLHALAIYVIVRGVHAAQDLRPFNRMRDTMSMAFSKINGFHLRTAPYTEVSPKINVQEVDFYTTTSASLPSKRQFRYGSDDCEMIVTKFSCCAKMNCRSLCSECCACWFAPDVLLWRLQRSHATIGCGARCIGNLGPVDHASDRRP